MIIFKPSDRPATCDSHRFSVDLTYNRMVPDDDLCSNVVLSDLDPENFTDDDTYERMESLVKSHELFVVKVNGLTEEIRLFTPVDLDVWLNVEREHLPTSYSNYDMSSYEFGMLMAKIHVMADIDSFAYAVRTDYCPTSREYSVIIATHNEDFWTDDHQIPIMALVEAIEILRKHLGAYAIVKANKE
jgi:hypothetical protein